MRCFRPLLALAMTVVSPLQNAAARPAPGLTVDPAVPNPLRGGPRPGVSSWAFSGISADLPPWEMEDLFNASHSAPPFARPPQGGWAASSMLDSTPSSMSTANGSIVAMQVYGCPNVDYSAAVTVGNQLFYAITDSGSGDFGVASDVCTQCDVKPTYHLSGANLHTPVRAVYGSGSWHGAAVQDTMSLGGGPTVHVVFSDIVQAEGFFGPNVCMVDHPLASNNQAIMGLGPNTLVTAPLTSYLATAAPHLRYPGFSFAPCDINGVLYLGGVPASGVTKAPFWTPMIPLSQSPYYSVLVTGLAVGGRDLGVGVPDLGLTVVDTGTTAFVVPDAVFDKIAASLEKASGGLLTAEFLNGGGCAHVPATVTAEAINSQAPSFTVKFYNPHNPSAPLSMTSTATNSYLLVRRNHDGSAYVCSMLQKAGKEPQTILGNTLMRGYNFAFDLQNWQVGVAPSTVCR